MSNFYMNVKSVIMKYRFLKPFPTFYCCTSIDILKKFYVQQGDGSCPSLSDTNRYDLFVFSIDTIERNEALKSCVAQVVYNRLAVKKPTWIYSPLTSTDQCVQVYSDDLKQYLTSYKTIDLENKCVGVSIAPTINKKSAENFTFFK